MVITGINQNRYLINNPIWVNITGAGEKVLLSFNSLQANLQNYSIFTFYTWNGSVELDLSEIIKGLMPEPSHPTNIISGQIIPGTTTFQILTFQSLGTVVQSYNFNKTFIRGGDGTMGENLTLPVGSVLKESPKIPVWQGYPSAKYTLNANNQIVFSNILNNNEIDRRKVVTCNPVFLRFLNTRGGYSFWMFEEWEITEKSSKTNRIDRRGNPLDLGLEMAWELSLNSRVPREYNATLSALLKSPEVHIYDINSILNDRGSGVSGVSEGRKKAQWTRIYPAGGSMAWNGFEEMNEYSFKFDLLFKEKPTLIW